MSSAGRAANSSGCVARPRAREIGLIGFAAQIRRSSLTGSYVMETAEHREPCESRGSRTVLGAPGGEIPPGDSPDGRPDRGQADVSMGRRRSQGEILDVLVQRRRDRRAAVKLMRKLMRKQGFAPKRVVTDKLRSYGAAFQVVYEGLQRGQAGAACCAPACGDRNRRRRLPGAWYDGNDARL